MAKKHEIEEFVFSFLLPHGGTETPPKNVNLYAGRWEGMPALFSFGSYHLLAVAETVGSSEQPWTSWKVNTSRPTRETSMHLNALYAALERCSYEKSEAMTATLEGQTGTFEVWSRKEDRG